MKVLFLQTSDQGEYSRLLQASSASAIEYCRRKSFQYEMFIGIIVGSKPWHAALNRISILKDKADRDGHGWVIYMDADAYIADLEFDLLAFLNLHSDRALIAAHAGAEPFDWWNINNGVLAINLDHPVARDVIVRWHDKLMSVPTDVLNAERWWSDVIDDQRILHEVLREVPGGEAATFIDREIFNWDNRFIRQTVRGSGSVDYRRQRLLQLVGEILGTGNESSESTMSLEKANGDFVKALYQTIFMREADAVGFATVTGHMSRGERNHRDELTACFGSPEFAEKAAIFLSTYLSTDNLRQVACELADQLSNSDRPG